MYNPPHFQELDTDEIGAIVSDAPLACIVAGTDEGLIANHIPLLSAPDGALIGHISAANDMHRLLSDGQDVLAVFRRDDAYISPNYYPTKPEHHRHVPTWNYQVVHCHGSITFQHDDHAKRSAVALLTRIHERRVNNDTPWRMSDAPKDYIDQMIGGIVAFRIDVRKVSGKSKLSQNREDIDHQGAIAGLRASGHEAMAGHMERRAPKTG